MNKTCEICGTIGAEVKTRKKDADGRWFWYNSQVNACNLCGLLVQRIPRNCIPAWLARVSRYQQSNPMKQHFYEVEPLAIQECNKKLYPDNVPDPSGIYKMDPQAAYVTVGSSKKCVGDLLQLVKCKTLFQREAIDALQDWEKENLLSQ